MLTSIFKYSASMKSLGGENKWRNRVHLTLKQQHSTLLSKTELYCSVLISQGNCYQLNLSSLFCVYQSTFEKESKRGKKDHRTGQDKKISLARVLEDYNHHRYQVTYLQGQSSLDSSHCFLQGKISMLCDEERHCLPQGPIWHSGEGS